MWPWPRPLGYILLPLMLLEGPDNADNSPVARAVNRSDLQPPRYLPKPETVMVGANVNKQSVA